MQFTPDYRHFVAVMENRRPDRLPIYEHLINVPVIETILDRTFADLITGNRDETREFFKHYIGFFKQMTYDVVSYEVCISEILPDNGAIRGGKPGPIQNRSDFVAYPWGELPAKFIKHAEYKFQALSEMMPEGMKAIGGIGNGVFELAEDLVGLEYLPFMQVDDPGLYRDLFQSIGDLMESIWTWFLAHHVGAFAACRFGDDLGFKASLLTNPQTVTLHILPQYRRIVNLIHSHAKKFLFHSCGNIFAVMDELVELGIDAKHSNEDIIAPFDRWIREYGSRIGLLGGFDIDFLCKSTDSEVLETIQEVGTRYRNASAGYALGSGNSIPEYVPVDNYLSMIEAAQKIREMEVHKT